MVDGRGWENPREDSRASMSDSAAGKSDMLVQREERTTPSSVILQKVLPSAESRCRRWGLLSLNSRSLDFRNGERNPSGLLGKKDAVCSVSLQ